MAWNGYKRSNPARFCHSRHRNCTRRFDSRRRDWAQNSGSSGRSPSPRFFLNRQNRRSFGTNPPGRHTCPTLPDLAIPLTHLCSHRSVKGMGIVRAFRVVVVLCSPGKPTDSIYHGGSCYSNLSLPLALLALSPERGRGDPGALPGPHVRCCRRKLVMSNANQTAFAQQDAQYLYCPGCRKVVRCSGRVGGEIAIRALLWGLFALARRTRLTWHACPACHARMMLPVNSPEVIETMRLRS